MCHYFTILFKILNNLYCTETSNTVLDHVIVDTLYWSHLLIPKCDYFLIHMDFVILHRSTEKNK